MESQRSETSAPTQPMKLLFVEMGVGYDQHGYAKMLRLQQCGLVEMPSLPIRSPLSEEGGVTFDEMNLQIKLGVPHRLQQSLDVEKVKSVFPYGKILNFGVVDGGLICSSGVVVEDIGDKNDDCYIVNAAVYIGY